MAASKRKSPADQCFANQCFSNRRSFLKGSAALTAGFSALLGALSIPETSKASDSNLNLLGPRPGYGPQVGTFISLLTWMREANGVINATKGLTKDDWDAAMNLGDAGRKAIKGHDRDYYLNILQETRAKSLAEFSKRDDAWLMAVDKDWSWGPTNNFCKWFHVCELEAHHTGQIAFLRKRLPGAKPDAE